MSVIRITKQKNFSIISNIPLNDSTLSFKAKGIWAYLMSKPDDWYVRIKHLATASLDRRDAVYSGIGELVKSGYMERVQLRDDTGKMSGVEYHVHEEPRVSTPQTDYPETGYPDTDNPPILKTDSIPLLKTDNNELRTEAPPEPSPLPEEEKPSSSVLKNKTEKQQLVSLVPELEKTPEVEARIEKAFKDGFNTEHIEYAINYTNAKTPDDYRTYLGLSIDNGWKGSMKPTKAQQRRLKEEQASLKAKQQHEAQMKREQATAATEAEERETLRDLNQRTSELMTTVDIPALDNFIANQELNAFEMKRFNSGKRELIRKRFVSEFTDRSL